MRWVDRGPEPAGVAGYARQFTQGWIDHYSQGRGQTPTDSYWNEFRSLLASRNNNICWYCERTCDDGAESGRPSPTVDHFKPRQIFPELTYEWSNWVFSCRRCNVENKQGKWPETGYVDPCADEPTERPERYFTYNEITGEIGPAARLSANSLQKARNTVEDLGLNKLDVRYYRFDWMRGFVADVMELPHSERRNFVSFILERPSEFAGSARTVAERLQRDGVI